MRRNLLPLFGLIILCCSCNTTSNIRESISNTLGGHNRADTMTDDVMNGRLSDAVNQSTLPPGSNCEQSRGSLIQDTYKIFPDKIYDTRLLALDGAFPKNCGYEWKEENKPPGTDEKNCAMLDSIIEGKPMPIRDENNQLVCISSDCNIATIMGMSYLMREQAKEAGPASPKMQRWNQIKDDFRCKGKAYELMAGTDSVKNFAQEYNLPNQKRVLKSDLNEQAALGKAGHPKPGDVFLFQRNEKHAVKNSAHAGIFSHYKKDASGNVSHVCMWSSYSPRRNFYANGEREEEKDWKPNGYTMMCESVEFLFYLQSASLEL